MWWAIGFLILVLIVSCIPSAETRRKMRLIELLDRPTDDLEQVKEKI